MNRRGFLGMLAGAIAAPAVLAEPERRTFLPPKGGWPVFDTANLQYKATERFSHGFIDQRALSNNLLTAQELSERAIEDLLIELSMQTDERGLFLRSPSMLIVPPRLAKSTMGALHLKDPGDRHMTNMPDSGLKYFARTGRRG